MSPSNPLPSKTLESFSREDVAKHTTEDDCWIVIENKVYDVTKWLPRHPGGKNLILNLAGKDCSEEFKIFHLNPCYALLRPYLVGEVVAEEVKEETALAKDVAQLLKSLKKKGAFEPDYWFYATRAAIILALFSCCIYFLQFPTVLSTLVSAFCLGMCWQQFAFTGHDLGHHVVTHNNKQDHVLGYIFGNLMQGISLAWWRHNHNTHHTVTNSVDYDPDIQHVPFLAVSNDFFKNMYSKYYNRTMKFDSVAKWFISSQHFWFYPVMMLARFNLYAQSYIYILAGAGSNSKEKYYELITLVIFASWLGYLLTFTASFGHALLFLFVSHAVAGIVHVQICINHFPMETFLGVPQKAYEDDGYIKSQLVTTTNIDCSPFMDFFHGGLQFQVEHHLFPHLTRSWLRYVQGEVRKICKKHDLPYYTRSFFGANLDVLKKLKAISVEARLADIFWDGFNMNG